MTKGKKITVILILTILALLLTGLLFGEKLEEIYRNVSFHWEERTVAELTVKAYADE